MPRRKDLKTIGKLIFITDMQNTVHATADLKNPSLVTDGDNTALSSFNNCSKMLYSVRILRNLVKSGSTCI